MVTMNTKTFLSLLTQPILLNKEHLTAIENIIQEFPYFQAAKALYLKGLRNEESFRYNTELKTTAAYTSDRHVLFDFITSKVFKNKQQPAIAIPESKKNIEDINVIASETLIPLQSVGMEDALKMKLPEANEILHPALFYKKEPAEEKLQQPTATPKHANNTIQESLEILQPDKPLAFDENEMYSFSEWLKITSLRPIQRVPMKNIAASLLTKKTPKKKDEGSEKILPQEKKFKIIDQFISNNPKIGRVSHETPSRNLAQENMANSETLMTETLAKVYIAQKNYKKAIQAYKILILKNPKKSGFFADQIRAIQNLQGNQ